MKQIYFIINPKAGNGHCFKIWKRVEHQLRGNNVSYLAFFTEYPGHAKDLASQIALKNLEQKIIIAVGGDGTMHEVMNGVVDDHHITLGFIPGGSGNDFSRGFQIPVDPLEAIAVILRLGKQKGLPIDVGKITLADSNEHYFINNMGAGFDAIISYEVNQSRMKALLNKLGMGRMVYVYFMLKKLFTYKTSTIDLSIDGKKHIFEQTWFVTVSNQPYYGGGMKIAPRAEPDDGLFDITVVHQLTRWKLLLVFISVFWGKHIHFKEVKTYTGRNVSIHSPTKLFVHADGEHIGFIPLKIDLQARALEVLTRRKHTEEVEMKERDSNDCY
ncbi:diacylglycerol kinase family lipid kinase [Bacillus sp. sid0103]|uniref:diacylglycerol/lipid kinase family protein n=1 Tax=Bacillus sp. sid0103 TaxID=2856337 RepID=UPI001C44032E|nr:diacylglycerol kinase family protein [Bacillus sp. sid0103]MBV7507332.1 diacylglycerol kinase family lipid kinase [Bacillus sp. sid0103]